MALLTAPYRKVVLLDQLNPATLAFAFQLSDPTPVLIADRDGSDRGIIAFRDGAPTYEQRKPEHNVLLSYAEENAEIELLGRLQVDRQTERPGLMCLFDQSWFISVLVPGNLGSDWLYYNILSGRLDGLPSTDAPVVCDEWRIWSPYKDPMGNRVSLRSYTVP